jgi:hypothetical protein
VLAEATGEETPGIFSPIEVDDESALQLGLSKNHVVLRQMGLLGRSRIKPERLPIKYRFHILKNPAALRFMNKP